MRSQSYKLKITRVIGQSLFLWIWVVFFPIAIGMVTPRAYRENDPTALIAVSLFFACLVIPGIVIFGNYLKYSRYIRIVANDNTLQMWNDASGSLVEIKYVEVDHLAIYKCKRSKFPWSEFEYFVVRGNNKIIIVPSFIISFGELAGDGFLRNIPNGELSQIENFFPIVRA